MSLFKSIATVGSMTMLSRITGLLREMMIAHFLGAGMIADAFFVAWRIPNMFRSLFAEGAFNAAFVPLFAGKLESEGREGALEFARSALSVLFWLLLIFIALLELFMPWVTGLMAPGFDGVPGKIALASDLSRITFPYLLFISLVSLQSGVLNSLDRFGVAAATPVLFNLTSIAFLYMLVPYTETPGHAMAWGTSAAGIIQFLWLFFHCRKIGVTMLPTRPKLTPEVRTLLRRVVPGAVGAGVYQVNLVINTMIASTVIDGAVSYLNYADRVNQLPLGVVGFAIGTALLPLLSRQIRAGETQAAQESQNRAMEFGLMLTLPAAIAMGVIATPLIRVLFQSGSFRAEDTAAVAAALAAFAVGLPANVLVKVLTPGFFARQDTTTPVMVAMLSLAVNVILNLLLKGPFAHVGMAISTSVSGWVNVLILGGLLHHRGYFRVDRRLWDRAARILAASLVMGAVLWEALALLPPVLLSGAWRVPGLILLIVLGGGVYFTTVILVGGARPAEIKSQLRRKRGTK